LDIDVANFASKRTKSAVEAFRKTNSFFPLWDRFQKSLLFVTIDDGVLERGNALTSFPKPVPARVDGWAADTDEGRVAAQLLKSIRKSWVGLAATRGQTFAKTSK
jgi:hypothetical protein